jgi:inactivated superfamily I helicase
LADTVSDCIGFIVAQTLAGILSNPPPQVDLSSLISQISKLWTYLKQLSQKAARFKDLSKALVMIADVATWWNSPFKMLERAYQIWTTIKLF